MIRFTPSVPSARLREQAMPWLLAVTLFTTAYGAFAQPSRQTAIGSYVPGRLLVKFKNDTDDSQEAEILEEENAQEEGSISGIDVKIVSLSVHASEQAALASFRNRPQVEFAELDCMLPPAAIPNDF